MSPKRFSVLLSELTRLTEELGHAHAEELNEVFCALKHASTYDANSPRSTRLKSPRHSDNSPSSEACSLPSPTRHSDKTQHGAQHVRISDLDAVILEEEESEWDAELDQEINEPIPSDLGPILSDLGDVQMIGSMEQDEHSDSSLVQESTYLRGSAFGEIFGAGNTIASAFSSAKSELQVKRQYKIRSPWCDYTELNDVNISDKVNIQKLEAQAQTRRKTQTSAYAMKMSSTICSERSRKDTASQICSCIIQHPDSGMRLIWVVVSMLFLMYDLIMVPVDVCFDLDETPWSEAIGLTSMTFWTLDIFYNFILGVQTPTQLETRPLQIAIIYAKSYLLFDLILVVPEWITSLLGESGGGHVGFLRGARVGRLVRLLRVARIFRILRMQPMLRQFMFQFHLFTVYLQITQGWLGLGLMMLFCLHLLACGWYSLGNALDDGWVRANQLESAGVGQAYILSYHWSAGRLHGITTSRVVETQVELLVDTLLIYGSLLSYALFTATVTSVGMTRAKSRTMALWQYGITFTQRHNVSPEVDRRLIKFLQASRSGGLGEAQTQEKLLLQALPTSLGQDLLFEARLKFVIVNPAFKDMDALNTRMVRQIICSTMAAQLYVEEEVIFAFGDGCQSCLFLTTGMLFYAYNTTPAEVITDQVDADWAATVNDDLQMSSQWLFGEAVISEAALWTMWENCGTLLAHEDSIALSLNASRFAEVITQHIGLCLLHLVKYAKHFVWHLNRIKMRDDLIEFPQLRMNNLDRPLFDGTVQDHFMFISHYKVEAGTEATLVRDSLDSIMSENPSHPANNYYSPIFIDSEDLSDLAELKTHVLKSECLLLLLTPGVLSRPWCLIEIVTAVQNNVKIVPVEVQRPGSSYSYPNDEFYARLLAGKFLSKEQVGVLETQGVSLQEVEEAIRQVFHKIAMPYSPHKTKLVREAELRDIWKRCNKNGHKTLMFI